MEAKKFFLLTGLIAMVSLTHTACTPEDIDPFDPTEVDSVWTDPTDSTDYGDGCDSTDYGDDYDDDDSTDIDLGGGDDPLDSTDFDDGWPEDDSTGTGGDSLYFGG